MNVWVNDITFPNLRAIQASWSSLWKYFRNVFGPFFDFIIIFGLYNIQLLNASFLFFFFFWVQREINVVLIRAIIRLKRSVYRYCPLLIVFHHHNTLSVGINCWLRVAISAAHCWVINMLLLSGELQVWFLSEANFKFDSCRKQIRSLLEVWCQLKRRSEKVWTKFRASPLKLNKV